MVKIAIIFISTIICILLFGCTVHKQQTISQVDTPPPPPKKKTYLPDIDIYSKVTFISTSPDTNTLALITNDDKIHEDQLILFSLVTQKVLCRTQINDWECEWSSDSKHVASLIMTGSDKFSIIVMDLNGKTQSFPAGGYIPDMQFRMNNPNKLLYCKQIPSSYEIWEIDLNKGEQKRIRDVSKYNGGLSAFYGQDCYSEYDYKPCQLGKLRVRNLDTNEVILNADLGGVDSDDAIVDFSPDSQWMAVRLHASGNTFILVGHVKDAMRFMVDQYVAAYSGREIHCIDWLPTSLKSKYCDYILINHGSDYTIVDLKHGDAYIENCSGLACWWNGYRDDIMGVVIDGNVLKGEILDESSMMSPDASLYNPDVRKLALLRKTR